MDSYRAKEISVIQMILPASYLPIIVVEYDNIRRCQIDTEASNASCEQEDELLVTRLVVLVDPTDMIIICGPAINTVVFCANRGKSTIQL